MALNVASPKSTGGGGFVFEDDVCAWLLACMLAGEPLFDVELGLPVQIDFQTRPDGWLLDDVLITTAFGPMRHRFAISIKSNAPFTASTAPVEFVSSAWDQWLQISSVVFDRTRDFMVLITAPLSTAAVGSICGLTEKARVADPGLFPGRLATPGWATEDERRLFASFDCPAPLNAASGGEIERTRLLQRLRFQQRDFGATASESLRAALELCRRCVRVHSAEEADALWSLLRRISAEYRPLAGSITLSGLVERLRGKADLADYPDHAADWAALDARSGREAGMVRDSIGGRIKISLDPKMAALASTLAANDLVALLGASGAGKSALARAMFERRTMSRERTLWLDARSLDCPDFGVFESALQLKHPLADLLSTSTARDPLLIVDGLDRIYSDQAFRNAAILLRLARQDDPSTNWRLLTPCQSQEWPRVIEALQRAGAVGGPWTFEQLEPPTAPELRTVSDAVPALARLLLLQPKLASLIANLKLLDLIVRRVDSGGALDPASWVGESSVADWFWDTEIDSGRDRVARGRFARELAQLQADQLASAVRVDDFGLSELGPLETLAADQLCVQVPGDRIAFAHELYGDWARLRILLNQRDNLPAFFRDRRQSPLWHRALRLLGVYLLEHSGGVREWRAVLSSFGKEELGVQHDVLLEAPVFAADARALLDAVLPDLLTNDGRLLRRMLTRFLAFATIPNSERVMLACSLGMDAGSARTQYRVPYWPYWVDVLAFLHAHRSVILRAAPSEIARIVEMWMSFAPSGTIRRGEAAELAVLLGEYALSNRNVYGGSEWRRERERFYRCALVAAHERPGEVATIVLTAAERVARAPGSEDSPHGPQRSPGRGPTIGRSSVSGPWPDGPNARVDPAFQTVVLESLAIRELFHVRPVVAREAVLATLIEGPREDGWNDHWMRRFELDIVNRTEWFPALYTRGPFLMCLLENFSEGLELIVRLVEFAAERESENGLRELNHWRDRALAAGQPQEDIDRVLAAAMPSPVRLFDGARSLTFTGSDGVYGWSAGLGNSPQPVRSALMALEQYFYQRLDRGEDVADEVSIVLARSRCVALLGVLCDVGKRHPALFEGPLRPLLSAPEIYGWEIAKIVSGRTPLMFGSFIEGEWFTKLARQFHGLEHRKADLRNIAIALMLSSTGMRDYFSDVRSWWRERGPDNGRVSELTQQLATALDPANYELREDPKHGSVLVNVEVERVQAARAAEDRVIHDEMTVMAFPVKCRRILDDRQRLGEQQLAELWESWSRIRQLAREGDRPANREGRLGNEYASAIAGGIAVLVWHQEWYSVETARRADLEAALRDILSAPPATRDFDSDDDAMTWTLECFAAEACAMLWARDRTNEEWRRMVGEAVLRQKYTAVKALFDRCAEYRATIGADFSRLRRLALEWAHLRNRIGLVGRVPPDSPSLEGKTIEQLQEELALCTKEKLSAFVDGKSDGMPVNWSECDEPFRFRELDATRRRWPGYPGIDFRVVRRSHEWLPLPNEARDPAERLEISRFWLNAFGVIAERPLADLLRGDRQYPRDDERWVLENTGATVLQLRPEEGPDLLWEPIFDLHSQAHDWPEVFAHSVHRQALSAERTPTNYVTLVRLMVRRAFTDVEGKRRWPGHEQVWDTLIGIDSHLCNLWEARHVETVKELADVFSIWTDKVALDGRRLGRVAIWLSGPAAGQIRLRTLEWILARVRVDEEDEPPYVQDAEDAIAMLLNVVWAEEASLRSSPGAFAAFRGLLTWLGDRQNRLGLELLGRLGSLG